MNIHYTLSASVLLVAFSAGSAAANEPVRLTHNPFSRPPSEVTPDERAQVMADGSVLPIDLRATLVSDREALANVAGRILGPGDEAQGYTLIEVFEDRAIFLHEDRQLVVYVKPQYVERDDE